MKKFNAIRFFLGISIVIGLSNLFLIYGFPSILPLKNKDNIYLFVFVLFVISLIVLFLLIRIYKKRPDRSIFIGFLFALFMVLWIVMPALILISSLF